MSDAKQVPPLISIIMPAYNAARFIDETIQSVRAQTYAEWELIVADDGSKDTTVDHVLKWSHQDPRIMLYQQKNAGPAKARNLALKHAKGRYICFLDADDIWLPRKLERQLYLMRENKWAFSFSQYRRFESDPVVTGRLIGVPSEVNYRELLSHNVIGTLTTMIDRQMTGPFTLVNEGYDDFILWLEILKRGFTAHGIQEDLARYRLVRGSVSSRKGRAAGWVWNIYRNVEKLSLPDAIVQFSKYAVKVSLKHAKH